MATENIKIIENLFEDSQTVSAININDYLNWAAHPDGYRLELAMPPIQRGFVWKPKQIQDLWDSLLRGMPIGSILLKSFGSKESSASLNSIGREFHESSKPGYHLIDGQQRTLSMMLGFPGTFRAEHKLWVDFSEAGKNGSKFQLRVSTPSQPFGYRPDGGRLSMRDRRDARKEWDTDDEKKSMTQLEIFEDAKPWKAEGDKRKFIIEIKLLWELLGQCNQNMDDWLAKVRNVFQKNGDAEINEDIIIRINSFGKSLVALQGQWLALIKIPDDRIKIISDLDDPNHDYLTLLFDRISSNGTRLSPDDLLFSMVKQSWPEAHNLVYKIQGEVGALMKPSDFVMTAYRLASLREHESISDDPQPNAKSFHKNLGRLLGHNQEKQGEMLKLISGDLLLKAFTALKDILGLKNVYDTEGVYDYGIPEAMFPYLDVPLLQILLHWILLRNNSIVINDHVRKDVIRFVLFWLVCNNGSASRYEASKLSIAIINRKKDFPENFPGLDIYNELSSKKSDGKPAIFCNLIVLPSSRDSQDTKFRNPNERAKYFFGEENEQLYHNFTKRISLLIWFQRKWIFDKCGKDGEFSEFKPLAGQDEDNVPYDFDHLVPQSNWSSLQSVTTKLTDTLKFNDLWPRRTLGNSIGNYRVLSATENRSRGDEPLESEFLMNIEIWKDSACPLKDNEIEFWNVASPKENCLLWDDKRVLAFQNAVETRVLNLYERYCEEATFKDWMQNCYAQ